MRKYILFIFFLAGTFSVFAQTRDCHADFIYALDSNGATHNSFWFYDQSSGTANQWLWSFGDGSSSLDRNPVHHYNNPGTYHVCLKIWTVFPGEQTNCLDSICKELHNANYYNLGGLLFAGLYPINNPVNTGDTGIAVLFRVNGSEIYATDTSKVTFLGYYSFPEVLEGNYIIKARLTQFSTHYNKFIPAYFDTLLRWHTAKIIILNAGPNFNNDIHLIAANDTMNGTGILRGTVVNTDNRESLTMEEVVLMNDSLQPLQSSYTDEKGGFEFHSLTFGTYHLFAEVTTKYSAIIKVNIDEGHPLNDTLLIPVSGNSSIGIGDPNFNGQHLIGKVFPNPVSENIHFSTHIQTAQNLVMKIYSCTGREMCFFTLPVRSGDYTLTVPVKSLGDGLYLLVVTDPLTGMTDVQKFLKF